MTLTKFLLIDSFLVIAGLAFLLILKDEKNKSSILEVFNSNGILDQETTALPKLKEILELEHIARKQGSGVKFESLIGKWRFVHVWKKETDRADYLSSSLLRLFSASLELQKSHINPELLEFVICNSIEFGALSIKFIGTGELKGNQPLLPFFFQSIQLTLGNQLLFKRVLEIPNAKNRPFFGLIAMGEDGKWLSARGRGGGLAIWVKDCMKH